MTQQPLPAAKWPNSLPGCFKSVTSRSMAVIIFLCLALMRPRLEYWVQFRAPQYRRTMGILENLQWRSSRVIEAGASLLRGEVEETRIVQCREEEAQGDLIHVSKCLMGGCKEDRDGPFFVMSSVRTKGSWAQVEVQKILYEYEKTPGWPYFEQRGWTRWPLEAPDNLKCSVIYSEVFCISFCFMFATRSIKVHSQAWLR